MGRKGVQAHSSILRDKPGVEQLRWEQKTGQGHAEDARHLAKP